MDSFRPVSSTSFMLDGQLVDLAALRAEGIACCSGAGVHRWNNAMHIVLSEYDLWLEEVADQGTPPPFRVGRVRAALKTLTDMRGVWARSQLAREYGAC